MSWKFRLALAVLGGVDELVERGAVQMFPAEPHGLDVRGVVNVGEGVAGEQNEVGALPRSNPAKLIAAAEKFGRAQRGGLDGLTSRGERRSGIGRVSCR